MPNIPVNFDEHLTHQFPMGVAQRKHCCRGNAGKHGFFHADDLLLLASIYISWFFLIK